MELRGAFWQIYILLHITNIKKGYMYAVRNELTLEHLLKVSESK